MVRRRMFSRLQRICEQRGDGALYVVAGVLEEALGPKIRDKGQYFCWVVKRRLEEQGYWEPAAPGPNQPPPAAEAVKNITRAIGQPGTPPVDQQAEDLRRKLEQQQLEILRLRAQLEGSRKVGAL